MSKALPYCDCEELNRLKTVVKKYQYEFKMLQTEATKDELCIHCDHQVVWSLMPFTEEADLHKRRRGKARSGRPATNYGVRTLLDHKEGALSTADITEELENLLDLFDEEAS
jgi:hypothetical protein